MKHAPKIEVTADCPWDPDRLESVARNPSHGRAILQMLLEQGQKTVGAMQQAKTDAKAQEWRRASHGLAGSALNLGMEQLAGYCREDMESTATEAQRNELCEQIRAELKRIAAYKESLD